MLICPSGKEKKKNTMKKYEKPQTFQMSHRWRELNNCTATNPIFITWGKTKNQQNA